MDIKVMLVDTELWYRLTDCEEYLDLVSRKMNFVGDQRERFFRGIRKWWAMYSPHFTAYRQKLKEITVANHERLGVDIIPTNDFDKLSRNQIVLVTDDDDWFNPTVVEEVNRAFVEHPEVDVVFWDCWKYDTSFMHERYELHTHDLLGSNAFAIRGGRERKFYTYGAHVTIEQNIDRSLMYKLEDKALSIWNIHPGSLWQRTHYDLHDNINVLEHTARPVCLDWAHHEIDSLYTLLTSMQKLA